jgi:biotin carboxylase
LLPEVALRATNKLERIKRLKECGIPCANYAFASDEDQLLKEAKKIGYPLIIKPIDSAGARGVQEVDSEDRLVRSYAEAILFSDTKTVLLEEKLIGPEISTESLVFNNQIYTFAFADRNYLKKDLFYPFFVEDGINYPSSLDENLKNEVYKLVEKTIKALEIDFGAAKGDIIIDRGIPKIIEMAARTSGGWFSAGSIRVATGSNVLKPLLQMSVGLSPDLSEVKPKYNLGCAQRYIIPVEDGVVTEISGLDEAVQSPGVQMSNFFMPKIGSRIKKSTNHSERFGQIICTGSSREEAIKRCEEAILKIKIKITPMD